MNLLLLLFVFVFLSFGESLLHLQMLKKTRQGGFFICLSFFSLFVGVVALSFACLLCWDQIKFVPFLI